MAYSGSERKHNVRIRVRYVPLVHTIAPDLPIHTASPEFTATGTNRWLDVPGQAGSDDRHAVFRTTAGIAGMTLLLNVLSMAWMATHRERVVSRIVLLTLLDCTIGRHDAPGMVAPASIMPRHDAGPGRTPGTTSGAWRIIQRMDTGIDRLRVLHACDSQLAASMVVAAATGSPVATLQGMRSTSQGVGAAGRLRALPWNIIPGIRSAGRLVPPAAAGCACHSRFVPTRRQS
jgi:hypothetical protein